MSTTIAEYTKTEAHVADLRQKYEGAVFDVATAKGMDDAKKARAEIRDDRVWLEKERVRIKAPALERCQQIDSEAKRIKGMLEALEDPIDAQIKAEEGRKETERLARVEAERLRLEAEEAARIEAQRAEMAAAQAEIDRQRAELQAQREAQEAAQKAIETERDRLAKIETDRLAQIEADRIAAERAEQDRLAAIERGRIQAEQAAKRDQEAAERAAQELARKAEQERQDAERAERQRVEDEKAAKERERIRKEREKIAAEKKVLRDAEIANADLHETIIEAVAFLKNHGHGEELVTLKLEAAGKRMPAKKKAA